MQELQQQQALHLRLKQVLVLLLGPYQPLPLVLLVPAAAAAVR
jgi:hypothetical protein